MATSSGVSQWTRRFAVASAVSTVALQVAFLVGVPLRAAALLGLLGVVLPMVFGMAYLIVPSYVGRTLTARRLPGAHFVLAYGGAGLLLGDELLGLGDAVGAVGALLWASGVATFVGTLLWTVAPAVAAGDTPDVDGIDRLATATIPVAFGYLVVGTYALVVATVDHSALAPVSGSVPVPAGATLPAVIHYYGVGVSALLVFALGIRLLSGFFRVTPPRSVAWVVLLCGAVAPAPLAAAFRRPPWFLVGVAGALLAAVGYAAIVGVVAVRTERRRVGLYGICLGAGGLVAAVGVATAGAAGVGHAPTVTVHVPLALDGFLVPTIVGYAYQFFPVTTGAYRGATERSARATILALGLGVALQALGALASLPLLRGVGATVALCGAAGYAYLLGRRLWR